MRAGRKGYFRQRDDAGELAITAHVRAHIGGNLEDRRLTVDRRRRDDRLEYFGSILESVGDGRRAFLVGLLCEQENQVYRGSYGSPVNRRKRK
jgi:hypothetical protein